MAAGEVAEIEEDVPVYHADVHVCHKEGEVPACLEVLVAHGEGEVPACLEVHVAHGEGEVPVSDAVALVFLVEVLVAHGEGKVPVSDAVALAFLVEEDEEVLVAHGEGEVPVSDAVALVFLAKEEVLVAHGEGEVPVSDVVDLASRGEKGGPGEEGGTSAVGLGVPSFSCLDLQTLGEVDESRLGFNCKICILCV